MYDSLTKEIAWSDSDAMIPMHLQESRMVSGQDALLSYLIMFCFVLPCRVLSFLIPVHLQESRVPSGQDLRRQVARRPTHQWWTDCSLCTGELSSCPVHAICVCNSSFQFGSVVEVIRPVDKLRGDAPKNFCFVTFEREEPARKLVKEGSTIIKGHQVVVSRVGRSFLMYNKLMC